MLLLSYFIGQLFVFVLVLTRISGLVMTAPIFGSRNVPIRVRAFLAVGLSLIITPTHTDAAASIPTHLVQLVCLIGREALLGLALGLTIQILFTSLQLTGQIVGQMSGMALADVYDPSFDTSVPVFAQLLDVVTMSVFLVIGGHRQVLGALLDTFRSRPPGALDLPDNLVPTLTGLLSESFLIGLRAAAPVMVALLMSILIMGLISRTLPQLNVIAVGFSINSMITLAVLGICLGAAVSVVLVRAEVILDVVREALAYG